MSAEDELIEIRCPTCSKSVHVPRDFAARPFCSSRCKTIDLGRWLDEDYRISRPIGEQDIDA